MGMAVDNGQETTNSVDDPDAPLLPKHKLFADE